MINATDFNLPNPQTIAIENGKVFTKILVSKNKNSEYPKEMEKGVLFVSSAIKLMAKDGSNNVLSAIGLWNENMQVSDTSSRFFRPTTFGELITAMQYTDINCLERFFRDGCENNTNLNQLICCFLKNNLDLEKLDVKELATTSFEIKDIIDGKAKTFYNEKENFYQNKIKKYEEKINTLKLEQQGLTLSGEVIESDEFAFAEVMEEFVSKQTSNGEFIDTETPVESILKFFSENKDVAQDVQ